MSYDRISSTTGATERDGSSRSITVTVVFQMKANRIRFSFHLYEYWSLKGRNLNKQIQYISLQSKPGHCDFCLHNSKLSVNHVTSG
jgi:hypothetical protein